MVPPDSMLFNVKFLAISTFSSIHAPSGYLTKKSTFPKHVVSRGRGIGLASGVLGGDDYRRPTSIENTVKSRI